MKYKIQITDVQVFDIVVEAKNEPEALRKTHLTWSEGGIDCVETCDNLLHREDRFTGFRTISRSD